MITTKVIFLLVSWLPFCMRVCDYILAENADEVRMNELHVRTNLKSWSRLERISTLFYLMKFWATAVSQLKGVKASSGGIPTPPCPNFCVWWKQTGRTRTSNFNSPTYYQWIHYQGLKPIRDRRPINVTITTPFFTRDCRSEENSMRDLLCCVMRFQGKYLFRFPYYWAWFTAVK